MRFKPTYRLTMLLWRLHGPGTRGRDLPWWQGRSETWHPKAPRHPGIQLTLSTHSLKAVEDGTLIVDATAVSMRNALNGVQNVVKTMDDIASASREQAYSVEQVTREMEQIAGVIQENSATAEESAAASEELSAQALLLKGLLERFRFDNTDVL